LFSASQRVLKWPVLTPGIAQWEGAYYSPPRREFPGNPPSLVSHHVYDCLLWNLGWFNHPGTALVYSAKSEGM